MGVKDGQYKVFRDLKNRVIDKAVEEVNKYSPIKLTPEYRKQGRKVIATQFIIQKENSNVVGLPNLIDDKSELPDILKEKFGLSNRQIEDIVKNYELNYIFEKIEVIENSKSYKTGKINNLGKYLISALADDYRPSKSSKEQVSKKDDVELTDFATGKVNEEMLYKYEQYQQREYMKHFSEMSENQKKVILKDFLKNIRGVYISVYEREGLDHPLVQQQLALYLRDSKSLVGHVLTYDEWLKKLQR